MSEEIGVKRKDNLPTIAVYCRPTAEAVGYCYAQKLLCESNSALALMALEKKRL